MNYLAHAYLSFGRAEVLVGNMISDFVKGKKKFDYPFGIRHGIELHRNIDSFTDEHEITKKAKEIFRPAYRLYSGAFVDAAYDHFLANDANEFSGDSLYGFSQEVYAILEKYKNWLPEHFALMFPYMKNYNWLFNYRSLAGIERSFGGLVRRSAYLTESGTACLLFEEHYEELKTLYSQFFPLLKKFSKQRLDILEPS